MAASVPPSRFHPPAACLSFLQFALKISLGKLHLSQPFEPFISEQLRENTMLLLHITVDAAAKVTTLPFHHRDPFDRLLIAQALAADISIVGADRAFDAYGVRRLW